VIDRHRTAAWIDLLRRYIAVWRHAWRDRPPFHADLLKEHEAAFLPSALAIQAEPVSPTVQRTAAVLVALFVLLLVWSILGHIDIVVNAPGKIIPSARVKTISAIEVASVRALHIEEGQPVKAGQVLVELDTSASDTERDKARGDHAVAILGAARETALIDALDHGRAPHLPPLAALRALDENIRSEQVQAEQEHLSGKYRDYLARRERIELTVSHLHEAVTLATRRAADYASLLPQHDVPVHAWLEREQARIDVERELADARQQRVALLEETRRTAYDQLAENNRVAASTRQDALRSAAHSKMLSLTSPVDGTVQQLNIHTVGGVVPPAQPLMQIVPDEDTVEVEATLENRDVGFVRQGQSAEVKIEAFDYTKYGTVPATVTHVARDAVKDDKNELTYAVKVTLRKTALGVDGRLVPLSPGLAVDVGIKTGERRLIDYLLSPLLHHQHEALHER
jgi:hemolysin D